MGQTSRLTSLHLEGNYFRCPILNYSFIDKNDYFTHVCQFQPTVMPTAFPSRDPSTLPSFSPSCIPSVHPSDFPSVIPTDLPSVVPTTFPSSAPTGRCNDEDYAILQDLFYDLNGPNWINNYLWEESN